MNARCLSRLQLPLVTGLAVACGGPANSDAVTDPVLELAGAPPAAAVGPLNPVHVEVGLGVTNPTAVEFLVQFVGVDPIGDLAPKPIQLALEAMVPGSPALTTEFSLTIQTESWTEHPKAVGTYVIEEASPSVNLPAVQIVQDGQVVADLTQGTDLFEASLRFDANLKAWVLIAELVSNLHPEDGFSLVTGAHIAELTVGADALLPAVIRESAADFAVPTGGPLHAAVETMGPSDPQGLEASLHFAGVDPLENGAPKEIQFGLDTELNFLPVMFTFTAQSESWTPHPKVVGGYVIDGETTALLPAVQMWLDGQLLADLTLESFEALLHFDANNKAWVLNLIAELEGDNGLTDGLSLVTGAHIAELMVGADQLSAGVRESGATFDVQPVF